jgi:hypothetical protein
MNSCKSAALKFNGALIDRNNRLVVTENTQLAEELAKGKTTLDLILQPQSVIIEIKKAKPIGWRQDKASGKAIVTRVADIGHVESNYPRINHPTSGTVSLLVGQEGVDCFQRLGNTAIEGLTLYQDEKSIAKQLFQEWLAPYLKNVPQRLTRV